jgi:hypothetical protein
MVESPRAAQRQHHANVMNSICSMTGDGDAESREAVETTEGPERLAMKPIVWIEYLRFRAQQRGFDLAELEHIMRYSTERYFDTQTLRRIVIGRCGHGLVLIAYEEDDAALTPVTVHPVTRLQITTRVQTGRLTL